MQLASDFEAELRAALLDDVERQLVGRRDNIVHRVVQRVHDVLREYADRYDYRAEPLLESLAQPQVSRGPRAVVVRVGWAHEAFPFFEFGTSDHTIEGNPVLSFVWEDRHDPPPWVAREFEREGNGFRVFLPEVEVAGLPESRAIRDTLHWLRRELA